MRSGKRLPNRGRGVEKDGWIDRKMNRIDLVADASNLTWCVAPRYKVLRERGSAGS